MSYAGSSRVHLKGSRRVKEWLVKRDGKVSNGLQSNDGPYPYVIVRDLVLHISTTSAISNNACVCPKEKRVNERDPAEMGRFS